MVERRRSSSSRLTYGSVCSGIEAASVAWRPLGWRPAFFAEIDPFPSAVLAARHPGVPNLGDFTRIGKDDVDAVDLLVAGTPCQDFSLAGKRLGIRAPRGNLALEFLALAARLRPRWIVFENVPGLLSNWSGAEGGPAEAGAEWESSENSDFAAFLGAVRECGYLGCWRVLDAQYAGLAQRRERVFFVGYLGDWRPAAAVLLEPESLCGYSPPRREAGQGVTPFIASGVEGVNGAGVGRVDDPMFTLDTTGAMAVAFSCKDYGGDSMDDCAPTLRAGMFDKSYANGGVMPAVAFAENSRAELRLEGGDGLVVGSLKTGGGKPGQSFPAIAFDARQSDVCQYGEQAGTLDTDPGSIGVLANVAVRRLTPRECERLQGFPDDYTAIRYRGKPAADGPRYRALGNSMAVPVMRGIGEHIVLVDGMIRES